MSWDVGLPRVDVPQGDQPKHCTIVLPYYENPHFLAHQLWAMGKLPGDIRTHLRLIVVDDGSPKSPAQAVLGSNFSNMRTRLFRVNVDVPWNWLTARNIGAKYADDGWLLMTDMDHVIPPETARALVYGRHNPNVVYAFSRTGTKTHPHSASFLMTKAMFWKIGGYDERFAGHYGSDGQYRKRLQAMAPLVVSKDHLVLHENQGDSSTTAYQRKLPEDSAAIVRIAKAIEGTPPLVLSFPYVEVAL